MERIAGVVGVCRTLVAGVLAAPVHHLTAAMDDFDELWMADLFLDQGESADRLR